MRQKNANSAAGKFIRLITYAIAIAIAVSFPAVYFSTHYQFVLGQVETKVQINAGFLTQRINNNPEMWRYEEHRLVNLIEKDVIQGSPETIYSILDSDRRVIAQNARDALPWPAIAHEAALLDSGNVVGYYSVARSIRDVMNETLMVALAGIVFGLLIILSVNVLPLRALHRAEERLLFMAHHDALTGLPNRVMLNERLNRAISFAERYGRLVNLVFIDLDNFKVINDGLGHNAGDVLLKTLADRMLKCTRSTDTVVRLGGDEFVIILPDQHDGRQSTDEILERLQQAVREPVQVGDRMLRVTCSMGLATYPSDGANAETLLMNADAAMYRAKEMGRNNCQSYTAELNSKNQKRLMMEEGLRNAIERNEFVLHYQPRVDLKTCRIFGVEALIRWRSPEWGMVSPMEFIPIAEESGLIMPIGEWVLETACLQSKTWQDAGVPPLIMAVNVSARQFGEKDCVGKIANTLQKIGLEADYLELELTESLIMKDLQQSVRTMRDLQEMGIQLTIDDFGTGYSSLSALKGFPLTRLKIDKSFVCGIPRDDDDNTIVTAMISLGQKLSLRVLAEGVETEEQLAFLRRNGCDEIQGFKFSKPVAAAEIEEMLRAQTGQDNLHYFSDEDVEFAGMQGDVSLV